MLTNDNAEVKGEACSLARLDDTPHAPMLGERWTKLMIVALGLGLLVYLLATGDWSALASTALGALASDVGRALR